MVCLGRQSSFKISGPTVVTAMVAVSETTSWVISQTRVSRRPRVGPGVALQPRSEEPGPGGGPRRAPAPGAQEDRWPSSPAARRRRTAVMFQSIYLSICLSVYLSICLSIFQFTPIFGGSHLSNTICLTHVFFNSCKSRSKLI